MEPSAVDDVLMKRIARGDPAAFTQLMRRHRGWVRSLMLAFVRDEDQADDLTQEVFTRVFHHAAGYDSRGTFVSWLKRIAVNLAKDALRKRGRLTLVPLDSTEEIRSAGSEFEPEAALSAMLRMEEALSAIRALPPEQRRILVLHYFQQMSLSEVAEALDCPLGTVKYRLFASLRRLRRTLAGRSEEDRGEEE